MHRPGLTRRRQAAREWPAALPFDVLSVNIGGEPNVKAIPGAASHCIPVKPISNLRDRLYALTAMGHPERLAVISSGTGCELALALSRQWLDATGKRPRITIFARSARLVPEHPVRAARLL